MLPFTLENKTVLITGASSGIGRGTAIACAEAGASCILVARNEKRLEETLAACAPGNHRIEVADLTSFEDMRRLVERMDSLDGLVQCAGIGDNHTPLKFITPEFVDELLGINVKSPILLLALFEKKRKLNKGASVVMISSISNFCASVAHSLYGASKGAIRAFVRGAALDLAGKHIRVNAIAPAMVNTPLINYSALTEEQRKADEAKYPLKRYGEPSDVANAAVYLLSDAASWVTGQEFVLDGGYTIGR